MTSFQEVIKSIPGLTHYYALDDVDQGKDLVGNVNGIIHGNVQFKADGAHFDGKSWVELPDSNDFSVTTTKELTIVAFLTVDDWKRVSHNNEYLHWMGKGKAGAHEWTFRTYIDGGGGEAPQRKRRISYYNFVPSGGLGTGSFVQETSHAEGREIVIGGVATTKGTGRTPGYSEMFSNGVSKDKDMFTSYNTVPANTNSPVCIGTRGDNTGFLVGHIRRVAFFNRELTPAEHKKIADARTLPERGAATQTVQPVVSTPVATTPAGNPQAASQLREKAGVLRKTADELDAMARSLSGQV